MENSENENYQHPWFHQTHRLFLGVLLLFVGAFIIFSQLNFFAFHLPNYFFSWKMFLIALGALFIFFRRKWWTGINLIIIGTAFLIPDILGIYNYDVWKLWPIVLILIGLSMLFKPKSMYCENKHWEKEYWKNHHYWRHHHHHWNHRWEDYDQNWRRNETKTDDDWTKK